MDQEQIKIQTARLKACGIDTNDLLPTITALNSMASEVGTDKLPQLTLAYGQVAMKGILMDGELNQFREAGISLIDLLAESMERPKGDIVRLVQDCRICFADIQKAVLNH